jgi:hypothetical protein
MSFCAACLMARRPVRCVAFISLLTLPQGQARGLGANYPSCYPLTAQTTSVVPHSNRRLGLWAAGLRCGADAAACVTALAASSPTIASVSSVSDSLASQPGYVQQRTDNEIGGCPGAWLHQPTGGSCGSGCLSRHDTSSRSIRSLPGPAFMAVGRVDSRTTRSGSKMTWRCWCPQALRDRSRPSRRPQGPRRPSR